jgi:hypothetical protein
LGNFPFPLPNDPLVFKKWLCGLDIDLLIEKSKTYAGKNGAKYLEAYPVETDSPSYRFMGFIKTFEKADFNFVKMGGTRRHVMICKL